jgi:hypothetical protein
MQLDPILTAIGLIGSAVVGAVTYSFRAGATHKEVMLKIEFLSELMDRVEKRLEHLERRYDYDGQYTTIRARRPEGHG